MSHPVVMTFIGELKRTMAEDAEAAMMRPKSDLFALGQAAGQYQGMQKSLDLIDSILRDDLNKEKSA